MADNVGGSADRLNLVIKNPGRDAKADFRLAVESASSLGQVKQLLQREYTGNPSPEAQTVCAGLAVVLYSPLSYHLLHATPISGATPQVLLSSLTQRFLLRMTLS